MGLRPWSSKILWGMGYGLFLFLVAEGSVRAFFWMYGKDIVVYRNYSFNRKPLLYLPDSVLGKRLKPSVSRNVMTSDFQLVYHTNNHGQREKELRETSKYKILYLGDSQTFGEGVEIGYRFSDLVEQKIDSVYSINTGVPGYGIVQMLEYLKSDALAFKPDHIFFCIIPADLSRGVYVKSQRAPHLVKQQSPQSKRRPFVERVNGWAKTSYLYTYAKVQLKLGLIKRSFNKRDAAVWRHLTGKNTIDELYKSKILEEVSREVFSEAETFCQDNKLPLTVINIGTQPLPWLGGILDDLSIAFLDVAPNLANEKKIRFEIDPHYNEKGHRLVADALVDYINSGFR